MKKITLVALAFVVFSCSEDEGQKSLKSVSIVEIAKATPELSTFVEAVERAGLTDELEGSGNFTVFAPDNAAFDLVLSTLGYTDVSEVSPVVLTKLLTYHILDSKVLTSDLTDGSTLTTTYGQDVTINVDSTLDEISVSDGDDTTADSYIVARDVKCSNGIIQRVDAVLVPNFGS